MKTLQVAIIDDEPLAIELLESYINQLDGINIVGTCKNAIEAFQLLNENTIDLIFLDINMPDISGFQFLKSLNTPPKVIFTTAYSEYGARSYEFNAIDYLLKPISFERFMLAVNKVFSTVSKQEIVIEETPRNEKLNLLFVKVDKKLKKIDLQTVLFIEALKDYITIYTENEKLIVHGSMKKIEQQLEDNPGFIRVHKSYIVNLKKVSEIDGNSILIARQSIPIGITHKEDLLKLFNEYRFL